MKLTYVKITNFRCIDQMEIRPQAYTTLIGPNNAGKSTVLRAIDLFLNQAKPDADEWRKGHEGDPITFECHFSDIKEWERAKPGVSALVQADMIKLRVTYTLLNDGGKQKVDDSWSAFKQTEEIEGWSDKWADLPDEFKTLGGNVGVEGKNFRSQESKEKVRQEIRTRLPNRVKVTGEDWTSEGISIPAAFQQALPEVQLIPAVRDATEDSKPGAKTSFGLLLKAMIIPAITASPEYHTLLAAVAGLESKLKGQGAEQLPEVKALTAEIEKRLSTLVPAKVSIGMDTPDSEKFVGSNTTLRMDDGTDTRVTLQGHGLQRALVFAMLEVLARRAAEVQEEGQEVTSRCKVLLFEEPELFIHPHLMRRLKDALKGLSDQPDWQVVTTTHSPFLVDIADDRRSLVLHQRSSSTSPPTIQQLRDDPLEGKEHERELLRATLDFNPAVCEAFFANNVVLVEGDTEVAVLTKQQKLYALAGVSPDKISATTIISCDGKWTIIPIARLLKAFGVNVKAVHDTDAKGRDAAELAACAEFDEYKANERIEAIVGEHKVHSVNDTFEHVLWPPADAPTSSKDKPYRAWKRVRELTEGKHDLQHAAQLAEIVNFVFD